MEGRCNTFFQGGISLYTWVGNATINIIISVAITTYYRIPTNCLQSLSRFPR